MLQVELTEAEFKEIIFSLSFNYQSSGEKRFIDTANEVASQTSLETYFEGINAGLGLVYPPPAEEEPAEEPIP